MRKSAVRYRTHAVPADVPALRRLVASTRVFHREERAIALELLDERLARGAKSGYSFFSPSGTASSWGTRPGAATR